MSYRDWNAYKVQTRGTINPGLILLLRAACYYECCAKGEMDVEQAMLALAPDFWELVHPMDDEAIDDYERSERLYPPNKPKLPYRRAAV